MKGFHRWLQSSTPYDKGNGSCFRKAAYKDEARAKKYAAKSEANTPGIKLYIYRCNLCGRYHLTKMRQQ